MNKTVVFKQIVLLKLFFLFFFSFRKVEFENGESEKSATELEEGEVEPATHDESSSRVPKNFYDKKKSFFYTIFVAVIG